MEYITRYESASEEDEFQDTSSSKLSYEQNKTSFFNLEDSSSSEEEITVNTDNRKSTTCSSQNTVPNADAADANYHFWKSNSEEANWEEAEKIWNVTGTKGVKSGNTAEKHKSDVELCGNYVPKRKKTTITRCDDPFSSEPNDGISCFQEQDKVAAKKSFYYIHHKIAPFLNQLEKNNKTARKLPRKSIDKLMEHTGPVNRLKWCTSQYSHLLLSAGSDKCVRIWSVFSNINKCVSTVSLHSKAVRDASWSRNGRNILSGGYDKRAIVTDAETGKAIIACEHDGYVSAVKYHPINYNYIICGTTNKLTSWDIRSTVKPVRTFTYNHDFGQVNDLLFLQNGAEFISCNDVVSKSSSDCNVMAWDFKTGVVLSNQIYQERYTCTRLMLHPFESKFFAQTQGDYIAEFSSVRPYKMNKCKRYDGHKVLGYNVGCDVNQSGTIIASGSSDGHVNFYDQHTTRKMHQLNLMDNSICLDVAFHPVFNSTLALSTWNGNIEIYQ